MAELVEGRHAAEFVLSEASRQRSRENGTVVTGQNLKAGTVVQDDGTGKLTEFTAAEATDGSLIDEAVGILLYDADATSADVDVSYIAREAEVNLKILTYPAESTAGGEEAHTIASLKKLQIIAR
ncbi:MAG: head decoration protein [Pseudomonadota bacterium]